MKKCSAQKTKCDKAERDAFNLKYTKERREKELASRAHRLSGDPDNQSQVSTLTTPDCPPIKKSKTKPSTKKFSRQKNTMTSWLITKSNTTDTTVASPSPSVSVTDATTTTSATSTSTTSATYTTPKVACAPPSITPYTGTNINSSWIAPPNDEIDYSKICAGNNPFHSCCEGKWRKICLHQVLDYLEDKSFEKISERSVRRVYYKTFLLMMKAEVLKETEYYELEDNIHLPRCMLEGLFREAFDLWKKIGHTST